ncbi:hypothetical protein [Bradyrhizobium elkanii]|uniref:hypothetical protein n=1 Tax=Bradyrhizobium elkanii TaxID=29448 RepID=UPI0020134E60|nr:hypothetical protein [Bradyrhizobium elkanii]
MSVAAEPVDEFHLRGAQVGRDRGIAGLQPKRAARQSLRRLVARIVYINGAQLEQRTKSRDHLDGHNGPIAKAVGPTRRRGKPDLIERDWNSIYRHIDLGVVAAKPPEGIEQRIDIRLQPARETFPVRRRFLSEAIGAGGIAQCLFGVAIVLALRRLGFDLQPIGQRRGADRRRIVGTEQTKEIERVSLLAQRATDDSDARRTQNASRCSDEIPLPCPPQQRWQASSHHDLLDCSAPPAC